MTTAFQTADINNNGFVDRAEFPPFVDRLAELGNGQAKRAAGLGQTGYDVGFGRVDSNNDGKISPSEAERFR